MRCSTSVSLAGYSKITIHDNSCTMDPLFTEIMFPHQTEEVTGDSKLFCSISPQQSWTASFFPYMWPHTDLQFIMLVLYLGVWSGIPVQLSQMLWICMFICTVICKMIYYCLCSVFNMQTTLVKQTGINTIIHYQTVWDVINWMWVTCFILGSWEVPYWLAIRELITKGYLHIAQDSLAT